MAATTAPLGVQAPWRPRGYPKLAAIMGKSDDIAIFRRFGELNMLSLLSLQEELTSLRKSFWVQCQADDGSGPPYEDFSRNFEALRMSSVTSKEEQYALLLKIRAKMKEYNELLLQVSQVSRLSKPEKDDFSFLRDWLRDPNGGDDFLAGTYSNEALLYEKAYEYDFVTMSKHSGRASEEDPFVRTLRKRVIRWYHLCIGQHRRNRKRIADEESNTVVYDESFAEKSANLVATVLSSVLPLVAIVILDRFQDTRTRIYIAVGITAVFAFILAVFTNARRVEIFGATATFAAVEVVFIGSVSGGPTEVKIVG